MLVVAVTERELDRAAQRDAPWHIGPQANLGWLTGLESSSRRGVGAECEEVHRVREKNREAGLEGPVRHRKIERCDKASETARVLCQDHQRTAEASDQLEGWRRWNLTGSRGRERLDDQGCAPRDQQ